MLKTVEKAEKGLRGEIVIPADKSVSHRSVMLLSLSQGEATIKNFSQGADCLSTLKLFQDLGVKIKHIDNNTLSVRSEGILKQADLPLNCGNSGTTMRLTAGILSGQKFNSVLVGDESLSKRPMARITEPLTQMGADISSVAGHAPLMIRASELHSITYNAPRASAQVKSCILLAGLNADGKTIYIEPSKSRDHTERMLKYLDADISFEGNVTTVSKSNMVAKDIEIVGDISSAAFFIVAGLIVPNSHIVIKNVGINETRSGIIDVVKRMGGNIEVFNQRLVSGEDVADIRVKYTENLNGCEIEGEDIPKLIDELPVIAVLATQANGTTVVKNAEDLKNKETDRIHYLVKELKKLGAEIEEQPDGYIVSGKSDLKGDVSVESYNDHRLAMSLYVAGLICEKEISISGFEWIKISFPEFERLINSLI